VQTEEAGTRVRARRAKAISRGRGRSVPRSRGPSRSVVVLGAERCLPYGVRAGGRPLCMHLANATTLCTGAPRAVSDGSGSWAHRKVLHRISMYECGRRWSHSVERSAPRFEEAGGEPHVLRPPFTKGITQPTGLRDRRRDLLARLDRLQDLYAMAIEDSPAERRKLLAQLFDRVWQDKGTIVAVKAPGAVRALLPDRRRHPGPRRNRVEPDRDARCHWRVRVPSLPPLTPRNSSRGFGVRYGR
jgi:hypothetical protein